MVDQHYNNTHSVDDMHQHDLLPILKQANQIASFSSLDRLLELMLDLILEVSGANFGTFYLVDHQTQELEFKVVKGDESSRKLLGRRIPLSEGVVGATVREKQPIFVEDITTDSRWYHQMRSETKSRLKNAFTVPIFAEEKIIGVVQLFNFHHLEVELIQFLGNRMASEVDKALLIEQSIQRNSRLTGLINIIGMISSTLDKDLVLGTILEKVKSLLDAEASSLFLMDEEGQTLGMYLSSNWTPEESHRFRVPIGQGIIGHVVATGETVVSNQVKADARHYQKIDQSSDFETRSILAVPLRSREITFGSRRGTFKERIIGGVEALNKRHGGFTEEDVQLLETMAGQSATVLQIAQFIDELNQLFLDVARSLAAAIDAKDKYTRGHSQRVSDFSVALAEHLGLDDETLYAVRLGALLHDVGKIGVPDAILNKPGRLTDEEFAMIKEHPLIGKRIMGHISLFAKELPALSEHHERFDGKGYPRGLKGEEISLMGRMVTVADVFDALTSDRIYRTALSTEEALDKIHHSAGTQFDPQCVAAFEKAYIAGKIKSQKEMQAEASKLDSTH